MNKKILFVDDEKNVLRGFKRTLRKKFKIDLAASGKSALAKFKENGQYAVIVADMKMPEMNGIELLSRIRKLYPDTVRVMLTGNADLDTAINAVNEGEIFKFLTKPCPPDRLIKSLNSALEQYRLITAEKELLDQTLKGSIKVLVDILSLINPRAFSRSSRIQNYTKKICSKLKLKNAWYYEIAALLSQLGCISVPPDILDKVYSLTELNEDEKLIYEQHPAIGRKLIMKIPRLKKVAYMIGGQMKALKDYPGNGINFSNPIMTGAQILKTVVDFDIYNSSGIEKETVISILKDKENIYNEKIVEALKTISLEKVETVIRNVKIGELHTNMVFDQDVKAKNGVVLITKGQEVTITTMEMLKTFHRGIGIEQPFRVIEMKT